MAEIRRVVLTCDLCGKGDDSNPPVEVETHRMSVDGSAEVEFETCAKCWSDHLRSVTKLSDVGRKIPKKGRPRRSVASLAKDADKAATAVAEAEEWAAVFPGHEKWRFTAHALMRMAQRGITPKQATHAAESATETWPGSEGNGTQWRINGRTKVLVGYNNAIVTVAKKDEVDEEVEAEAHQLAEAS